eukprot:CAMPEP_0114556678 /NCGR_PEP_ID=MMETSP0114-20121206/9417_1 /TAXON_ID=31324 /ORGANISM="Goniomonas sp, Strain m" /LENGTH=634 /DNA_ID=CAMNT_0001741899 /DNA_START=10 /DNA_END=1911 /DNA_ORIENTATION=-
MAVFGRLTINVLDYEDLTEEQLLGNNPILEIDHHSTNLVLPLVRKFSKKGVKPVPQGIEPLSTAINVYSGATLNIRLQRSSSGQKRSPRRTPGKPKTPSEGAPPAEDYPVPPLGALCYKFSLKEIDFDQPLTLTLASADSEVEGDVARLQLDFLLEDDEEFQETMDLVNECVDELVAGTYAATFDAMCERKKYIHAAEVSCLKMLDVIKTDEITHDRGYDIQAEAQPLPAWAWSWVPDDEPDKCATDSHSAGVLPIRVLEKGKMETEGAASPKAARGGRQLLGPGAKTLRSLTSAIVAGNRLKKALGTQPASNSVPPSPGPSAPGSVSSRVSQRPSSARVASAPTATKVPVRPATARPGGRPAAPSTGTGGMGVSSSTPLPVPALNTPTAPGAPSARAQSARPSATATKPAAPVRPSSAAPARPRPASATKQKTPMQRMSSVDSIEGPDMAALLLDNGPLLRQLFGKFAGVQEHLTKPELTVGPGSVVPLEAVLASESTMFFPGLVVNMLKAYGIVPGMVTEAELRDMIGDAAVAKGFNYVVFTKVVAKTAVLAYSRSRTAATRLVLSVDKVSHFLHFIANGPKTRNNSLAQELDDLPSFDELTMLRRTTERLVARTTNTESRNRQQEKLLGAK